MPKTIITYGLLGFFLTVTISAIFANFTICAPLPDAVKVSIFCIVAFAAGAIIGLAVGFAAIVTARALRTRRVRYDEG